MLSAIYPSLCTQSRQIGCCYNVLRYRNETSVIVNFYNSLIDYSVLKTFYNVFFILTYFAFMFFCVFMFLMLVCFHFSKHISTQVLEEL